MLKILDWTDRNRAALNHIRKMRLGRGIKPMATLCLDTYRDDTAPTSAEARFIELVGARNGDAFWRRVNRYCATRCAQDGEIRVPRAEFGRLVLSVAGDQVGRSLGERTYDALVAAGLAEAIFRASTGDGTGDGTSAGPVTARDTVRDGTRAVSVPSPTPVRDGTKPPPVTAREPVRDGTEPSAVTAQDFARAITGARAPTRNGRATGAQQARDGRARNGVVSSLGGPSRAVTGDAPDRTRPEKSLSAEAPRPAATANGSTAAVNGNEAPAIEIRLNQAYASEIDTSWDQVQRTGRGGPHTRDEVVRAVLGLHLLSDREGRGDNELTWLRFQKWGDRGVRWLEQSLRLLADRQVPELVAVEPVAVAAPSPSAPVAPAMVPPPAASSEVAKGGKPSLAPSSIECPEVVPPSLPAAAPAVSKWVAQAQLHLRLRGQIASIELAPILEAITALAGRKGWQSATARAACETPLKSRDHVWLRDVRTCLARAAEGPPPAYVASEELQRVSRELTWLSTDAERPELAQRAADHLHANRATEAGPGDWRAEAEEILREAATTPAGSAA